MSKYARGSRAWGICDRTGFRYALKDLVYEYNNGTRTGRRIGRDMVDPDHPQNFVGKVRTNDPMSLWDPRPDPRDDAGLFGFDPVGNPANYMTLAPGTVSIVITTVNDLTGPLDLGGGDGDLELEGGGDLELEGMG